MENTKDIIDKLYFCAAQCERCHYACHREKDREMLDRCMMLDQDCTELCRLTAQVIERNSENSELLLKACAEACLKCAEECEMHADMEHCKKCAEACRATAELCNTAQVQAK
ncbi:MAG: four-helix bundle copper-binding protein [Bacteroidia bacterium]